MIKANELRPGNWLLYNEDGNWRPLELNYVAKDEKGFKGWYADFGWCSTTLEDIFNDGDLGVKSIKLSIDWLKRLGFVYHESFNHWVKTWGKNGTVFVKYDADYLRFLVQLGKGHYRAVEYVHELQNGFYWLTCGEELITGEKEGEV